MRGSIVGLELVCIFSCAKPPTHANEAIGSLVDGSSQTLSRNSARDRATDQTHHRHFEYCWARRDLNIHEWRTGQEPRPHAVLRGRV